MLPAEESTSLPSAVYPLRERDGSNPIERKAVYRAQLEIKSMPASLVVQIALWPDKLADWAKETGVAPAVVYNMLANVKPYHRVRTLLARRLNVPKSYLDHLIEARRPEPIAKLPPDPPPEAPSRPPKGPYPPAPGAEARAQEVLTPRVAFPERRSRRGSANPERIAGRAVSQMALNL